MDLAPLKTCTKCNESRLVADFYGSRVSSDGLRSWCKPCFKGRERARWANSSAQVRERRAANTRRWRIENAEGHARQRVEYREQNREEIRCRDRTRHAEFPARKLLSGAKARAKQVGMEFSVTLDDIMPLPKVCPVLGIELRKGIHSGDDHSYSLDRTDNSRGYVPGNVAVISRRANRIKNDATLAEVELLFNYLKDMKP